MGLSAKERIIFREYEEAFQAEGIRLFQTVMFRSSTTVEEARSNADERLLHWTVRRRFRRLLTEIHTRINVHSHSRSPVSYAKRHRTTQQSRATAAANA
jgi:hypothetical protein